MKKKLYLLETISVHRLLYVLEADSKYDVEDLYNEGCLGDETFQEHVGEMTFSTREITKKEFLEMFDNMHSYSKDMSLKEKEKYIYKGKKNASSS
jgi:hypothetical protein